MVGWIGRTLSQISGSVGVGNAPSNEIFAKTLELDASRLFPSGIYPTNEAFDYAIDLALSVRSEFDLPDSQILIGSVIECIEQLIISNAILPPEIDWDHVDHEGYEGQMLRLYLERHKRFHRNHEVNKKRFEHGVFSFFAALFLHLPQMPLGEESNTRGFGVTLSDLIPHPHDAVDELLGIGFNGDLQDARLFEDLRERFEYNLCAVSKIDIRNRSVNPHRYKMPKDFEGSRSKLVDGYLTGTPFKSLLETPLPFKIPDKARFEHTHVVGGTGHGKTQLLSHLIMKDMCDILEGRKKSIVLIDSQGDFIRKISSMKIFDPSNLVGLGDKLVLIDPSDVEYPIALNIFSINKERLEQYGPAERERILNGAIELYEHFFQGLLGAELTQKQGVAFSYLARLMLELPNATIFTLRDIMDDPTPFKGEIAKLSGSVRMFFEREFLSNSFNQTRKQISRRLWGILAIPAFERMFGQTEHKVDLFNLLNSGKIILINTSKDLLKKEGSAIFGKFFLAAIAQAIGERAVLAEADRTDTIIYLDEAHEYADESLEVLLNQGRKYKAGVVIAHQFLDQLNPSARQTLLANASVKIVGGLSNKDNRSFASEMGTDVSFLESLRKRESGTEFGLWVKNQLPNALRLSVPFGLLEGAVRLDAEGEHYQRLVNRSNYCIRTTPEFETQSEAPPTAPEKPTQPQAGRGGTQHREIQQMIKGIAHDYGFGVSVEAQCKHSDGAIDVLIEGENKSFAVEVSVTTSAEHELANLKKCLAEDVDEVWCVTPDQVHRLEIQNLVLERLPQTQSARIRYFGPDMISNYIKQFDERETTLIRGYEVVVQTAPSDPEDVAYREMRINNLLKNE
jgi:hypothetical protein